jgi:hypothetical protein
MLLQPELFQIRVMEGIAVNRPKVPLLHDVWKVFATELELEDPIALVTQELLTNPEGLLPLLGRMANLRQTPPVSWQDCRAVE